MEITCDSCKSKFKIADEKIPEGKAASFACPKCKNKISVSRSEEPVSPETDLELDLATEFGFEEDSEEPGEKPFDFIEEEGKVALVCESDAVIKEKIIHALEILEYHVNDAKDSRDALRKLRYKVFDMVVVDEYFGTKDPDRNGVLIYIERLHMDTRRNMFVTMISDRFRTLDYMRAFSKSVDLIINKKNIEDLEKILSRSLTEYDMFYRIYKETKL
jgi:predicted Zn finger-like uncharacterized protein